jgi:predicted nucleic acid-binding protein
VTIEVKLTPEIEARLTAEAQAQGLPVERVAELVLERALAGRSGPQGNLAVEDFRAMLNGLAEGSERLPNLPTESFSRESFYQGRG